MNQDILITELEKVGIRVKDIYELVNTNKSYPLAIPVLIKALESGVEDKKLKEGIVRALTVKEAKGKANKQLLKEYYNTNDHLLRWIIGNTFSVIITDHDLPEIVKIVQNKEYGISRQMFVTGMGKIKGTEDYLIDLLKEEELTPHALGALGNIKSKKAIIPISALLSHPKSLIKREAEKALKKISKG